MTKLSLPSQRAFTLIELLAVVTIVGILAALALVGYRQFLRGSRSANAKAIVSAIRVAQESYRAETLSYLSCSDNLTEWYPRKPSGKRSHWINTSHPKLDCWRTLNVPVDSATAYGFAVVAGRTGAVPPQPNTTYQPSWPQKTTEPWFVIQAAGDADSDGKFSFFLASSFGGGIRMENETE